MRPTLNARHGRGLIAVPLAAALVLVSPSFVRGQVVNATLSSSPTSVQSSLFTTSAPSSPTSVQSWLFTTSPPSSATNYIPFDPFVSEAPTASGSDIVLTNVVASDPQATTVPAETTPLSGPASTPVSSPRNALPIHDGGLHVQPRTVLNFTLLSTSPVLDYFPSKPAMADQGWNLTYSNVSWSHWVNGSGPELQSIGLGMPLQTTSMPGASVNVFFIGSAIYFSGMLNGTVSISATDTHLPQRPSSPVTFNYTGDGTKSGTPDMSLLGSANIPSQYNVTLTVESGTFSLESVIIRAPLGGQGARATIKTLSLIDDIVDIIADDFTPIGEWFGTDGFCGSRWNGTQLNEECTQDRYAVAKTQSQNARMQFTAPANTSVFTVYGTIGSDYGPFQVGTAQYPWDPNQATYTAFSSWAKSDVPLYTGVLDPREINTVNIDYVGDDNHTLELYQIVFYLTVGGFTDYDYIPSFQSESSSLSAGGLAGAIIGGIVGLALLVCLVWCCVRRRRRRRTAQKDASETEKPFAQKRAVGLPLGPASDAGSMFEVDETRSRADPQPTMITPLPLPRLPPTSELSTRELLERKMAEARERSVLSPTTSTSRPLSPTTIHDLDNPPTLPPLKLSLMTDGLRPSGPSLRTPNTTSSPASVRGPSPLTSTSPVTSPVVTETSSGKARREPSQSLPQTTVTEEEDAGRLPINVTETVPPRYNPAWADDYATNGTVSDLNAGTLMAAGPSVLGERQRIDHLVGSEQEVVAASAEDSPVSPASESAHRFLLSSPPESSARASSSTSCQVESGP